MASPRRPYWRHVSDGNVELIRRGFEVWNVAVGVRDEAEARAALEAALRGYHPDVEVDFSRTTPDVAPARGHDAVATWAASLRAGLDHVRFNFEPEEFIAEGDAVVVPVRITAQAGESGTELERDFVYVFGFDDGLIVSATNFPTLAEALEAVGRA